MQDRAKKERFGSVQQISESQYNDEVNKAGPGVWVVLLLFQHGYQKEPSFSRCLLLTRNLQHPRVPARQSAS